MKTKIKQIKNKLTQKYNFKYAMILAAVLTSIFWGLVYGGHYYYEKKVAEIYQDGWEVGNFEGLQNGYENGYNDAYDEFYKGLSKNPEVSKLFKKYFPSMEQAKIMRAISLAESKGKQTAINKANKNKTIDAGFFQINTVHRKKGETKEQFIARMHDLEENFKEAKRVLDTQGYKAWVTYNTGAYLTYMK